MLEVVDWLAEMAPVRHGCLAFLDFEKAYNYMHRCLEHYSIRAGCRQWNYFCSVTW